MSSVLGFQLQVALGALERLGIAVEPLCRGLSFAGPADVKGRRWVPWEEVATLVNRLPPQDPKLIRQFAVEFNRASPLIQTIGRLSSDLRLFLEMYANGTRAIAPYVDFKVRDDGEVLHLQATLQPGLTPCPLWFEWSVQLIASVPETVGLPPLELRSWKVTGTSAELTIVLPPSPPGAVLSRAELADALELLESTLRGDRRVPAESTSANTSEVLALQKEFSLTRAEAKVALQIANGRSPKECAATLGSSYETVRTHLRRVYAKLGVSSQRALTQHIERWRRRRAPRPTPRPSPRRRS